MRNKYLLISLIISIISLSIKSQEIGFPIIRNYTSKEYGNKPQVWSVLQDERGVMYFGCGEGIMEYDGVYWRTIPTPNKTVAYDLSANSAGKIYVAGINEFGYLQINQKGYTVYRSLKPQLKDSTIKLGTVWSVKHTNKFVYFRTTDAIFQYSPTNEKFTIFRAETNDRFQGEFIYKDVYFVRLVKNGLMKIENQQLIPALQSEFFKNKNKFIVALTYDDSTFLIPTRTEGLFLYQPNKDTVPSAFSLSKPKFLKDNDIYFGANFGTDNFILGSIKAGAMLLNKQGHLVQQYNENNLLQNNTVNYITNDKTRNIWFGLQDGIAKTESGLDVCFWNKLVGLKGSVYSVIRYKERIYIATSTKIYYLDTDNQVQEVKNVPTGQNWCFFDWNNGQSLLSGTQFGIYEIKGENAIPVIKGSHALKIYRSVKNPNRIFSTSSPNFISLRYENGKWTAEGIWDGIKADIRSITEDETGDIWLGTYNHGVIRIKPVENSKNLANRQGLNIALDTTVYTTSFGMKYTVRYYNQKDGFGSLSFALPFRYKNRIIWGTKSGLYIYRPKTDRFEPYCELGKQFCNESHSEFLFKEMADGKIWICAEENKKNDIGYLQPDGKGSYTWVYAPFRRLPEMYIEALYLEPSGVAWIGGSEGLFRYDMSKDRKDYSQKFNCLVRKVTIAGDSVLFGGNKLNVSHLENVKIGYKHNSIKFQFAAPFFDSEEKTVYAYQLVGYDTTWSIYERKTEKEYTNLKEGTYTFKVKAKNIYDVESEKDTYTFTILPPWHHTMWAYTMYVILSIGLVFFIVKIYTRRLIAQKEYLAKIVKERTAEVIQQKEAIELQRDQLEVSYNNVQMLNEIGKDITRNINAQHIADTVYQHINQLMEADFFSIGIFQPEKNNILVFAKEDSVTQEPFYYDLNDKNRLATICFEQKQDIFISDMDVEYIQYMNERKKPVSGNYVSSIIYLPLFLKNECIGTISVQSYNKNAYTQNDRNLLENIALYASIALENADIYKDLENQKNELQVTNAILAQKKLEIQAQADELEAINEELFAANDELYNQKETLRETLNSLKETQNQLIQSEKMASLGVLAAGVAHEINNPLNFINGGIIGIEQYFSENAQAETSNIEFCIYSINEGLKRASEIVASLSHFNRSGEFISEKTDIHFIINNCLIILKNITTNRIEIIRNYTNKAYSLYGNEGKLYLAFFNILINAAQAIKDTGTITINTEIEVGALKISISDTGCGISKEDLPKIIDPFFTTKDPGQGKGLGLTITYNILQEHSGTINFESTEGKGTLVTITLPIKGNEE